MSAGTSVDEAMAFLSRCPPGQECLWAVRGAGRCAGTTAWILASSPDAAVKKCLREDSAPFFEVGEVALARVDELTVEQRAAIATRVARTGRVMIWYHEPLFVGLDLEPVTARPASE